jgi:hypothetical protein
MKSLILTSITVALLAAGTALKAQDRQEEYLGLPGDNLNLYAVMQLFQNSKTLEEFERELNDRNSNINNLDLNYDNLVDYIKVIDNVDGSVHNIVLQVAVGPRDNQDVAVFTVVRFNNGQVQIQLTGDEALYGKYYIIEPITEETPNPGYNGNYERTTYTQISYWPVVRYIYLPTYTVWRSRWYWGYYPSYWDPWHTYSWHYYYGYHYNWNNHYYSHYHHYDKHRHSGWNDYYYHGRRSYSPQVSQRISTGVYKTTYSRPEERRKGEQMFAEKHPDEYRRSSEVNNFKNSRRSVNTSTATNSRSNNSVSRSDSRSGSSVNKSTNTVTRSSSDKVNNGSSRRSSESVSNKPASTEKSNSKPNNFKNYRRSESSEVKKSGQQSTQSVNRQAAPARQKSSGSEARKSESSQKTRSSGEKSKSESSKSTKDTETKSERRK